MIGLIEGEPPEALMTENSTRYIRDGMGAVRPYLYGNASLVRLLTIGLEGEITGRHETPIGAHIEVKLGDGYIIVESSENFPDTMELTQSSTYVYVPDVDAAYERLIGLGAISISAPEDKPYAERQCGVKDGMGNTWWVATYTGEAAGSK